jgi:hypothetical protein
MHLVMKRNGNFRFSSHVHDSGFNNIDYVISGVLMTPQGIAFTFQHQGHVEGTVAGLPFGTPDRNDDFTQSGNNPQIVSEFDHLSGARLDARLDGKDTLVGGLENLVEDLVDELKRSSARLLQRLS